MFVYWAFEDQGSGLVIQGYTEAARALGHEVAVYGCWRLGEHNPTIPLELLAGPRVGRRRRVPLRVDDALKPGDHLDLVRLVGKVPRQRRVIIDGDGNYNDLFSVEGDYNHRDAEAARRWIEIVRQPLRQDLPADPPPPAAERAPVPLLRLQPGVGACRSTSATRSSTLLYVGHSKFRWRPMQPRAAGDRAGPRAARPHRAGRPRLGRAAVVGRARCRSRTLTSRTPTT